MKTIKDIDAQIQHWEDGFPKDQLPTYRRMFCNALGVAKANSGDEAVSIFDLGIKIKNCLENDIDLENAEFELLRRCVIANTANLYAHFQAQMIKKLNFKEIL